MVGTEVVSLITIFVAIEALAPGEVRVRFQPGVRVFITAKHRSEMLELICSRCLDDIMILLLVDGEEVPQIYYERTKHRLDVFAPVRL